MEISELRKKFLNDVLHFKGAPEVLVVAVKLPTGAVEIITNTTLISSKLDYYLEAYDSMFNLKANPKVQVVGYMLV